MHIIAHARDISVWYANATNCNKIWYITASSELGGDVVFILLGAVWWSVGVAIVRVDLVVLNNYMFATREV